MKVIENTTYTLELSREEYLLLHDIVGDMNVQFLIEIGKEQEDLDKVRQMFQVMHKIFH